MYVCMYVCMDGWMYIIYKTIKYDYSDYTLQRMNMTCIQHQYHHTIPYHTIPYHTMPYHTIPYHTISYHTISYHTIPYHTIPYHIIPYHTIPYHTIPYHTIHPHTLPLQIITFSGRNMLLCFLMQCRTIVQSPVQPLQSQSQHQMFENTQI